MKTIHNTKIIGIDHGYGNMKTANCCFPTGITAYDHEPLFTADMLTEVKAFTITDFITKKAIRTRISPATKATTSPTIIPPPVR